MRKIILSIIVAAAFVTACNPQDPNLDCVPLTQSLIDRTHAQYENHLWWIDGYIVGMGEFEDSDAFACAPKGTPLANKLTDS